MAPTELNLVEVALELNENRKAVHAVSSTWNSFFIVLPTLPNSSPVCVYCTPIPPSVLTSLVTSLRKCFIPSLTRPDPPILHTHNLNLLF